MRLHIHPLLEEYYTPKYKFIGFLFKLFPVLDRFFQKFPEKIKNIIYNWNAYVNERTVEVPFVLLNIGPEKEKILDVGCSRSVLSILMAEQGHNVWGIDINDYGLNDLPFTFIKGDICKTDFQDNFFDCVVAVSTIEHIGIGAYGDSPDENKEKLAIKEIFRILKPSGKFIVTLPYGKKSIGKDLRIYDEQSLNSLLEQFKIEKIKYYVKKGNAWIECNKEDAKNEEWNEKNRNNAVVLVVARK